MDLGKFYGLIYGHSKLAMSFTIFNMLTYHYISHGLHVLGCLYSSCDLTSGPMLSPVTPVTPCGPLLEPCGPCDKS